MNLPKCDSRQLFRFLQVKGIAFKVAEATTSDKFRGLGECSYNSLWLKNFFVSLVIELEVVITSIILLVSLLHSRNLLIFIDIAELGEPHYPHVLYFSFCQNLYFIGVQFAIIWLSCNMFKP